MRFQIRKLVTISAAALGHCKTDRVSNAQPVKLILSGLVREAPQWDDKNNAFTINKYKTFAENYRAMMDTVNLDNLESVLMRIQTNGIDQEDRKECVRGRGMKYILIYEVIVRQPDAVLQGNDTSNIPEFYKYIPMKSGACQATNETQPNECRKLYDKNYQGYIGPFVGAQLRKNDTHAPYENARQFSFANSCPTKITSEKDRECRALQQGGLCAFSNVPDGIKCTFTYKILGYLSIDDMVQITSLDSSITKAHYKDYAEFCKDKNGKYKGIEFEAGNDWSKVKSIAFWKKPTDVDTCAKRVTTLVARYDSAAKRDNRMKLIPTINQLRAANPPCSKNVKICQQKTCKRQGYDQICVITS